MKLAVILLWLCSALPLSSTKRTCVCACIRKCGHLDIYRLSFVIFDGYRNQKAVQNQLYWEVLTEVRDLKKTVACRGFLRKWSDNRYIFLCEQQNELNQIISCMMESYIYLHTHRSTRICCLESEWEELLWSKYLNTIRWVRVIDLTVLEQ